MIRKFASNSNVSFCFRFLADFSSTGKFKRDIDTDIIVDYEVGSGCSHLDNSSLKFHSSLSFYFEKVKIEQHVQVSAATLSFKGPKKHSEFPLRVHVYANVPKTFVTECGFTFYAIKPLITIDVTVAEKKKDSDETVIQMSEHFQRLFDSTAWDYEASFAVVTETDTEIDVQKQNSPLASIAFSYSYGMYY